MGEGQRWQPLLPSIPHTDLAYFLNVCVPSVEDSAKPRDSKPCLIQGPSARASTT